ncbi:ARM repeat-containing protein [Suillus paluster]|uniref:ARM repeat-containing protein n=1 Tax=Suillus paluster TaxID=48578 RepID=UPI001B86D7EB|nr:ARM repeat-containing protein [Suillus paluster]KAG1752648.1 ARM repeat-containing protein [Suillus paluster]
MNMAKLSKLGPVTEVVDPQELYRVITQASSQNPAEVRASSKRVEELLDCFGTFDGLHEIAATRSVPLHVRKQSIIQFKNKALNHWKSRKLLSDEHRVRIRVRCMTFFDEEDDTIAECNEIIVAKIARQDYPMNWSSLLADIMDVIRTNLQVLCASPNSDPRSILALRRGLALLNCVLKEFSGVKMLTGVKTMANIIDQLHEVIFAYYSQLSAMISALVPPALGDQRTADNLIVAHLIYKCLSKMALWLWPRLIKPEKGGFEKLEPWFLQLFQSSTGQLKILSELRINLVLALRESGASDRITLLSIDRLTRHVRVFGKFFRRLQQLEPVKFVELPTGNEIVLYYWDRVVQATNGPPELIQDAPTAVFPVRFLLQAMVLFKENLARWTPFRKGGPKTETTLSQEFVEDAVRLLVTRFIPLNPADLKGWMSDPEEWVNLEDKENDQWEYELRPCGERVLMTLSSQYKDYVTPLLETTFKQTIAQPTVDLASVIQKEALYCAIGRCATRLRDVIPFNQWLEHNLLAEAMETNQNYPIIKRRIAWLIGRWISDMCTPANDPKVWEILIHLLRDRGPGTDSVVRLTAATALRECVDTVDFDIDVFTPFLPAAVTELVRLMGEADTMEVKQRLAKSLNVVIERAGSRITPHAQMISGGIPQLWTAAGEEWLFKAQLLVIVTSLVSAMKEQSYLTPLIVPLVREGLSQGVAINLDEDALNLWLAAVRNSSSLSCAGGPGLIDLVPLAVSLLSNNLDLLGKIVSIVESCLFADAPAVLQSFSFSLMEAFVKALTGQAILTNQKDILICLQFLTQLAPAALWGKAMHDAGLFSYIVDLLNHDESSPTLLTECIYLLARIAMADRQMFMQLVLATQTANLPETKIWEAVLDHWWRQFDHMSEPRHRKLAALGIASLVSTGRPEVLDRLPTEIFNLWTDVFFEVKESRNLAENEDASPLTLHWDLDQVPQSYYADSENTMEFDRRKMFLDNDPVRTIQLTNYVAAALQEAERTCGGVNIFNQYISKADPTLLKQLQDELRGE